MNSRIIMHSSKGQKIRKHLISLIMAISLVLVSAQVFPVLWSVYSDQEAFDVELQQIAGRATLAQWHDRAIVQSVLELASKKDFRLRHHDVQVRRGRGRPDVTIFVNYSRTQRFPGGYLHDFQFSSEVTGTSGL